MRDLFGRGVGAEILERWERQYVYAQRKPGDKALDMAYRQGQQDFVTKLTQMVRASDDDS
ncbi:MAG: hypothetical protein GVY18_15695 [Bacteroidetes bacterium]|nr:hypothetical protein [Bacteroidota bacterium]